MYVLSQEYGILTNFSMFEEMRSLKYFLNRRFVHALVSRETISFTFNTPFKTMKDGDHFDTHLGY